jgi:hypothetical protein
MDRPCNLLQWHPVVTNFVVTYLLKIRDQTTPPFFYMAFMLSASLGFGASEVRKFLSRGCSQ